MSEIFGGNLAAPSSVSCLIGIHCIAPKTLGRQKHHPPSFGSFIVVLHSSGRPEKQNLPSPEAVSSYSSTSLAPPSTPSSLLREGGRELANGEGGENLKAPSPFSNYNETPSPRSRSRFIARRSVNSGEWSRRATSRKQRKRVSGPGERAPETVQVPQDD